MSNIPPELSDHILDFLHDDRRALKACSLTCRTWYPTSRYHLYRKVHLHSLEGCQTFTQILHSSPYLGQFARYLNLCNIAPHDPKHLGKASELTSLWPHILSSLPYVEDLDASFMTIDHTLTTLLTQNFARTAELTLQYCRFHSFGDLASVLLAFPALQRCTLRGVSWDGGNGAVDHATERRDHGARLKALTLGRDLNREVLVPWLLQERLCGRLETLTASLSSEADAVIFQDLISASAKSLQHLDLDWYFSSFNDVGLPFEFSLRDCSSLRSLTLRCPIALRSTVPWVTALLADVHPGKLDRLTFEIRLLGTLDALDWDRLQAILLGDSFKSLQTVEFKIVQWNTASERTVDVESFVRSRLPDLESRCMLQFI